jgi:superfamily II DNA helicase RecQ
MSDDKKPGKRPAPEVLQRMRDNLVQMTQYCENTSDCRRFLLLKVCSLGGPYLRPVP